MMESTREGRGRSEEDRGLLGREGEIDVKRERGSCGGAENDRAEEEIRRRIYLHIFELPPIHSRDTCAVPPNL